MKTMKTGFLLMIVVLAGALNASAQDPHFSQYGNMSIAMNPANTAVKHDLRIASNYRRQWGSVATPFQTTALSFDINTSKSPRPSAYLGIGAQFLYDRSGDSKLSMTQGSLNLSGVLVPDEYNKISLGIMGGFGQRSLDYSALRWESQYDGQYNAGLSSQENFANNSASYFDAGAGFTWSYGKDQSYITANNGVKASVGVAAFHFGLPRISFLGDIEQRLATKWVGHAEAEFGKPNTHLTVIPMALYTRQGSQQEIVLGSNFRYLLKEGSHFTGFVKQSSITLGAHYRVGDALIALLSVEYANFAVGCSYDITVSQLTPYNQLRGGFELSLRFVTPNPFSSPGSRSRFR